MKKASKNTKQMVALLIAVCLCVVTLAGCTSPSKQQVVKDTLVVGLTQEPDRLDPQDTTLHLARQINCNIYDNLIEKTVDGNYVPALAQEWNMSDDGMEFTFKLRHGVKFHNGEELKASDVVFTFNRGVENAPSHFFFSCVDSATAIDEYSVLIKLGFAFAGFKDLLTMPQMGIVNEKAVTESGDSYARNPVGTGAYQFVNWTSGKSIRLKANADYWRETALTPNVEFRFVTDPSTGMMSLEKGEIDIFYNINANDKQAVDENPDLVYEQHASTSYMQILLNNDAEYLNDVNVRKAIIYAIDKEGIIQVASKGLAILANNHIAPNMVGYNDEIKAYPYDVAKAKECLAASQYPNGFEISILVSSGEREKIAQVIQSNLGEIGITVKIDVMEFATLCNHTDVGEYSMAILGRNLHLLDPALSLDNNFNSSYIGPGGNYQRYKNPQVDEYLARVLVEQDPTVRNSLFDKIMWALHDDVANVPLFWMVENIAYHKALKNIDIREYPYLDLRKITY